MATSSSSVDLAKLFGTVASTLAENRDSLNSADDTNHNHGDNMVQTFQTITQAVNARKNAAPSDQLAYASQLLTQKQSSGSSKLYAAGLSDAAASLAGQKTINADNAMQLVQSLLGAGQQAPVQAAGGGSSDLLGSLLGGLTGSQTSQQSGAGAEDVLGELLGGLTGSQTSQQPSEVTGSGAGDLLGSILGGLGGGNSGAATGQQSGIDMNTLINAGMSYMQAKQQGSSNLQAIINAVVGSSRMNTSAAHTQSGTLVTNTLMQVLSQILKK